MDEKDRHEVAWRRKAIRLTLKGLRPREILQHIPRSRTWLFNWQNRFAQSGWERLKGQARRPRHSPHAYDDRARAVVLRVRRSLEQRRVGLHGAGAVQQEIRQHHLLKPAPALATLNRWRHTAGLLQASPAPPTAYYRGRIAPRGAARAQGPRSAARRVPCSGGAAEARAPRGRPPRAAARAESEGPFLPIIRRERVCVSWGGAI